MSTLTVGPASTYPTIAAALLDAVSGDTILLQVGYSNETATVTANGITLDGSATSTGIVLQLDAGVTDLNLVGTAPINVLDSSSGGSTIAGNAGDNVITVTGGLDHVEGGLGNDRLVVDYSTTTTAVVGAFDSAFGSAGVGSVSITANTFEHFTILTGTGANTITTGDGDDRIITQGDLPSTIVAGAGKNFILTHDGSDTITVTTGNDTIVAGGGDNTITGTTGDKFIFTDAGADTITMTAGNNIIEAGDGANTITVTAGNNVIHAGSGSDTITVTSGNNEICAGEGTNTITATGGNNTICAGNYTDTITVTSGNNTIFAGNGTNTITATLGNNIIIGGDDTDTITTTDGSNYVDAGNGVNTVTLGAGNDTVITGINTDTVLAGAGHDVIYANGGTDAIAGEGGVDTLVVDYRAMTTDVISGPLAGAVSYAGNISAGAEGTLTYAGIEDFFIATGSGNDSITTGDGNDTIDGGSGNDVVQAGAGDDLIHGGYGDIIDGGLGTDTLNMYGLGPYETAYDPANSLNGTIYELDALGQRTGQTLVFTNIEHIVNVLPPEPTDVIVDHPDPDCATIIVPCFTLGTIISTSTGPQLIETLKKGDLVLTRDNGFKPIVWSGTRELSGAQLSEDDALQPISIRRDAFGNDCPNRDMMVSRQHRMLMCGARAELWFGTHEVLVRALHLTSLPGVDAMILASVTYVHIMFDQHEIVLADGAWSESFQPGDRTLSGMDAEQRQELDTIFPELSTVNRFANYDAARMTLKSHEARVYLTA
jgi:Ca2+-binding RTX toxin-like protein